MSDAWPPLHGWISCWPQIAQRLCEIWGCLHSDSILCESSIHPCLCDCITSEWPHMLLRLQGVYDTCHVESPLPVVLSLCRFKQGDDLASESDNPLANTMMPAMSDMLSGTTRCPAQRGSHRALRMPTPKVKPGLAAAHSWSPVCMHTWGAHWQFRAWRGHAAHC